MSMLPKKRIDNFVIEVLEEASVEIEVAEEEDEVAEDFPQEFIIKVFYTSNTYNVRW